MTFYPAARVVFEFDDIPLPWILKEDGWKKCKEGYLLTEDGWAKIVTGSVKLEDGLKVFKN
jgi:hypothetical protein